MNLVTRAQWGARPAKQTTKLIVSQLKGVAVHYTAMNADEQALHKNCAARVKGIQNYHMDTNGWSDIAYNFLVCKHGVVFQGRGFGIRSAAQGTNDGNDGYHAVCFLGDDTAGRDDVTDMGRRALTQIIREAQNRYPHARQVLPHSSFHSTACPGDELRDYIKSEQWKKPVPKPPAKHSPPWELLHGTKVLAHGRLSSPLFLRKVKAALVQHGEVRLREKK